MSKTSFPKKNLPEIGPLFQLPFLVFVLLLVSSSAAQAEPSARFYLSNTGSSLVFSGSSFELEVRASLNIPVAAVAVEVSATGEAEVQLTGRSAAPREDNGLVYISEFSQQPYDDGLPRDIMVEDSSPEVLLGMDPFPYDTIDPARDALIETLEFTATGLGEVTIFLSDAQAATTLWIRDGTAVTDVSIDPASVTISVVEALLGDIDIDGDVDPEDLLIMIQCRKGQIDPSSELFARSDLDDDADVDRDDVFLFNSQYGTGTSGKAVSGEFAGKGEEIAPARSELIQALTTWARTESLGSALTTAINPDPNRDYNINHKDLTFIRVRLGEDPSLGEEFERADVNEDGFIDLVDLVAVRNRMGTRSYDSMNLRINEVMISPATGEYPWVELRNLSVQALRLNNWQIHNKDGLLCTVPDSWADPNVFVQIVFDGPQPAEYIRDASNKVIAMRLHVEEISEPFDPTEDLCFFGIENPWTGLRREVDSVGWGDGREHENYLNIQHRPIPPGGSIGRDGYEPHLWVRFSDPTPAAANSLPAPEAMIPFFDGIVFSATTTPFAWADFRNAVMAYRIQVSATESFEALLVDEVAAGTVHEVSPALAPGEYYWRVRAEAGEFVSPWSATAAFTVELLPSELLPSKPGDSSSPGSSTTVMIDAYMLSGFLPVPHKDTNMVCLECEHDKGAHAWDKPHSPAAQPCTHDFGYAINASIVSIVKYYGGTILQDQIAYYAHGTQEPVVLPEGELGHGEGALTPQQAKDALAWALGGPDTVSEQIITSGGGTVAWDILKGYIDSGIPMLLVELKTTWLGGLFNQTWGEPVVGYQEIVEPGGETKRRLLIQNPWLTTNFQIQPQDWNNIKSAHLLIPVPENISVQPGDPSVWNEDSDADGLIDVDEELRFSTLETKGDSDHDGVSDKTEIWSYVFGRGIVPRIADIDGDGLRAEKDEDSDNDNCKDGLEDLNSNGNYVIFPGFQIPYTSLYAKRLKEKMERDPFWDDELTLDAYVWFEMIGFNRTSEIYMSVTDVDSDPVENQILLVDVTPKTIGFVDNAGPVTDEKGEVTTVFTADHEEGTANIRVILDPCRFSTSEPKYQEQLTIEVFPLDWIFAVQDEARMTGIEEPDPFDVRTYSGRCLADQGRIKVGDKQTVKGHFYHPEIPEPEKYIENIWVDKRETYVSLIIDGTPMLDWEWVRSATEEKPKNWEITIDTTAPWQVPPFPRYLYVETVAGVEVKTPLVWWQYGQSWANAVRDYLSEGSNTYKVLDRDYVNTSACFFFGDGDSEGMDYGFLWPDQVHSNVSFIPTGTITGAGITLPVRYAERAGYWAPFNEWRNQISGVAHNYDVCYYQKSDAYITPPFPWEVRTETLPAGMTMDQILVPELHALNPMDVPDLMNDVQFQRDYIKDELVELQKRSLTPPDTIIHMYSQ